MSDARAFWTLFAVCACASLALLWWPKYLPMTDLPQHAAQIAVWRDFDEPLFHYGATFERQYFTPYLVGYVIARVVAEVTNALVAVKVTVTLAVLALPWSLTRLTRAAGVDVWWSLAGFAMAFGFSFTWGLLNYIVAIPVGILLLAYALDYAAAPTQRNGVVLAVATLCAFLAHGLVLFVCGGAAALIVLASADRSAGLRLALRRMWPFVFAPVLAVAWTLLAQTKEAAASMPAHYGYTPMRVVLLPALLVGLIRDRLALAMGALLLFLMVASGLRPIRSAARLAPLGFFVVVYLALPRDIFDTSLLYPRVGVFFLPLLLVACAETRSWLRPQLLHASLVAAVLLWLGLTGLRFAIFDQEARAFDPLLAKMEPGKRVRGMIFERATAGYDESLPFLHFPAWYQALKGGEMDYTFGHTKTALIHYLPGKRPYATTDRPLWPHLFDPLTETIDYDYFVVHAETPIGHHIFGRSPLPVSFEGRSGDWWLYRRHDEPPTPPQPPAPPASVSASASASAAP